MRITFKLLNHYIEYLIGSEHNYSRDYLLKTIDVKKELKKDSGKAFAYVFNTNTVWEFLLSNEDTKNALASRKIESIEELDFSVSNYLHDLEFQKF